MKGSHDRHTVQSVERALKILIVLAEAGTPLTLTQIRDKADLNISTAHRLLHTLMNDGFINQDKDNGKYLLGLRTFEVGHAALYSMDIRTTARPFLQELVDRCNETTNLAILDQGEVVYIDQIESLNMIKIFARVGSRGPAHCVGAGKALLAQLSDRELKLFIEQKAPLERFTEFTICDPEKLIAEMAKIRKHGYALDNGELEEGVRCVAVPVWDYENKAIAAISVSGPDTRLTDAFILERLIPEVMAAADKISERLGHRKR
ncbi:IclR family transcriptional regulator [Dethiobacter alkaliphilus]|uniref:Glycerol operon regulatory protein n=1 Tax=Dethiobacter alkaliphilus AHT 1 TaxID=555088 RepID=C0GIL8_DETAL|nr:IclR family transcriptional regulator [Dethiobacter alkaliphilus]EEG76879.1 transcriptional regulator, IclR family [Dethiobacter alkaliphilus AHT 1]